ncbi:MAG TPA: ATP-binding protein [Candidatus Omnitrophota bacterium]|nr:ATP-binding protein [Candidatus Omnitrophota bacterium]
MSLFSFSGILLSGTSLILIVILLRYGRSSVHRTWALFNTTVAVWGIFAFLIGKEKNPDDALLWWRFAHISISFIPVFLYHFVFLLCKRKNNKWIIFVYLQAVIFSSLSFTPILFSTVRLTDTNFYYAIPSASYIYFLIMWMCLVAISHIHLFREYFRSEGIRRNQILYLFIGSVVGFSGGITNFMVAYSQPVYPSGNFTIPIYSLIVTYAILKYRLLDITVAITRTGIFLAVYSVVLGLPFALAFGAQKYLIKIYDLNWWIIPLGSSTILATVGPYIYLFIQKKAEDRLLQEQRQYQATLRKASLGMGQIKDLKRLLSLIVHVVTKAVRIEHCKIFLYHEASNRFVLKAAKNKRLEEVKLNVVDANNVLITTLVKTKEPIVYQEIKQQKTDYFEDKNLYELEKLLTLLDAELVVPSFIEQTLIAFIVLGKKYSGKMYTQDDLVVFSILASQSALAIENAMFHEETKRTHEQLFKAEKMATIGTMADGLSHQINNRLHAMGFIAGDALDTLRRFKDKPVPADAKEVLDNIQNALERIEENVKRGGEIVQGLLTYTRKGEEGFVSVDLDKLLDASIEMAAFKIKTKEIDFHRHFDSQTPKVRGNFTQLQEVLFNVIDNSYDAIMQRKSELGERGYRGVIDIAANTNGTKLELVIRDNGMGVKDENKNKIFTPFFTTKLSSKKGTGLGMYVIKKIIEENHRGKVEFTSQYKVGSQTKLLLPLHNPDFKDFSQKT